MDVGFLCVLGMHNEQEHLTPCSLVDFLHQFMLWHEPHVFVYVKKNTEISDWVTLTGL